MFDNLTNSPEANSPEINSLDGSGITSSEINLHTVHRIAKKVEMTAQHKAIEAELAAHKATLVAISARTRELVLVPGSDQELRDLEAEALTKKVLVAPLRIRVVALRAAHGEAVLKALRPNLISSAGEAYKLCTRLKDVLWVVEKINTEARRAGDPGFTVPYLGDLDFAIERLKQLAGK